MSFWGDERSQSVQVGAIILFGFLVIGISTYQVTVVPAQNEGVEFNHNQRVTAEMTDVRNAILRTAETGNSQPESVTLGTTFPSRTLFVNPPPATGEIQTVGTTDPRYNVTITNATAQSPEVADFWGGSAKTFPTGLLVYEPNYREFSGAGNITYGHSLLYKKFDNGNAITLTDQSIVDDRTIRLVMLNGSLSKAGVGSYTVQTRGLSVSERTITIRSNDIVNITLPTRLPESKWRETVGSEQSVYLNYTNVPGERYNLVNISLKPDTTYELQLAKVGVGDLPSDAEQDTDAAYVTDVEGLSDSPPKGAEDRVVVEVRDKYNNPVSGVQVNVTTDGNATVKNLTETTAEGVANQTTSADGRVTFLVTPNQTDANVTVNVSIYDGDDLSENVTFEATTQAAPGAGGSGGGGGGGGGSDDGGDAGTGGVTDYDNQTSDIISSSGGLWVNITNASSIRLSNPKFSPTRPKDGQSVEKERYFRLAFTVSNATREYTFVFGDKDNGISYQIKNDGIQWKSKKVTLYKYNKTTSTTATLFSDKKMTDFALTDWVEGSSLDVLNNLTYEKPDQVEPGLSEVRRFLNDSNEAEMFITNMHGRTTMQITNRTDDNTATFLKVDDGSNNVEPTAVDVDSDGDSLYSSLKFGLINQLPNDQIDAIETINISVTNRADAKLIKGNGGTTAYSAPVYFDGNNQPGYITSPVETGTTASFDQVAGIDSGGSGVVLKLFKFHDESDPAAAGASDWIDLQTGDTVRVTFTYTVDGQTYSQTLTFEITNRVSNGN